MLNLPEDDCRMLAPTIVAMGEHPAQAEEACDWLSENMTSEDAVPILPMNNTTAAIIVRLAILGAEVLDVLTGMPENETAISKALDEYDAEG
jgi:hypothetical protein